jgi:toxin ParE1/3/4
MGFRLLPEAESDLDGIWLYVVQESNSVEAANRLIDALVERCWMLGRQPQIGRPRDQDLRPGLRSFPVGEYVIVYRLEGREVLVLHGVRGSRDVLKLLGD